MCGWREEREGRGRVSRRRAMTGSRRHARTVLGGRRRGKRPRSPGGRSAMADGVANGHGRARTGGTTKVTAWWATISQERTKAPSARRGCDKVAKATTHACGERKQYSRAKGQVVAYRTNKEKEAGYIPSLLCAPSPHSSPLGLAPMIAHNVTQPKPPSVTGTCQRRDRRDSASGGGERCSILVHARS